MSQITIHVNQYVAKNKLMHNTFTKYLLSPALGQPLSQALGNHSTHIKAKQRSPCLRGADTLAASTQHLT